MIRLSGLVLLPWLVSSGPVIPGPSAEDFGRLPAVESVVLSPTGSHLAAVRNIGGEPFLVTHELSVQGDEGTHHIQLDLRKDLVEKFDSIHWLNDDTVGVVLRFDGMRFGAKTVETRLIALPSDLSNATLIPKPDKRKRYRSQLAGNILSLLPDDPEHILMSLDRSGLGQQLGVYKVHVRTGEVRTVVVGGEHVASYLVDRRGRVRLRSDILEDKVRLFVLNLEKKTWRQLAAAPRPDGLNFKPVSFAAEPNTLLVFARNRSGFRALFEYDLTQKALGSVVYSLPDADVTGLRLDPHTWKVSGVRFAIDYPETHYFDEELQKIQASVDLALTETQNSIGSYDRTRTRFVVLATGPRHPGTYYVYSREANELHPVAKRYEQLDPKNLRPVESVSYSARDGLTIHGYLTRPEGDPPYPLVLLPHGGPTARDYLGFNYRAQFLASRGYAVLQPNFRGSIGYGAEFLAAGMGQWGLAMQDDLEDGTKAMIERGLADPERICIVGWSYGGYAALIATVKTPDLYACAVSGAGVTDIPRILSESAQFKFRTKNQPSIGHIRKDRDKLRDNSPINGIDAITTPILLVHGNKDQIVPVGHSKRMASRLKKSGKPCELLILESGDHHLSLERNRIRYLKRLEAFLRLHLGR